MLKMKSFLKKVEMFLYNFVLSFYRLNDSTTERCDAIMAHGYELTRKDGLSDATLQGVEHAILLAKQFPAAQIFLISAILRGEKKKEIEDALKRKILGRAGMKIRAVLSPIGACDTEDEVRIMSGLLRTRRPIDLFIVCDAAQMRCARIFWRYYRPNDRLHFLGFEGKWNSEHMGVLQRSPLLWLATNFFRHALLLSFGVQLTGRISKLLKGVEA